MKKEFKITIRLTEEELLGLEKLSEDFGTTKSSYLRYILNEEFDKENIKTEIRKILNKGGK